MPKAKLASDVVSAAQQIAEDMDGTICDVVTELLDRGGDYDYSNKEFAKAANEMDRKFRKELCKQIMKGAGVAVV